MHVEARVEHSFDGIQHYFNYLTHSILLPAYRHMPILGQ
jgi:hypothetical protein